MKKRFRHLVVFITVISLIMAFSVPVIAQDNVQSLVPEDIYGPVDPNGPLSPDIPGAPDQPIGPLQPDQPNQPDIPQIEPGFHYGADGKVTYYDKNGVMVKGWKTISGKKYYFSTKTGAMAKGWKTISSKKYYFSTKTGAMAKGWKTISGKKYYFSTKTGAMLKGIHKIENYKYFFHNTKGYMLTGLIKSKGNVYNIDSKGRIKRTIYGNKKAVALTYDDGPASGTKSIVKVLKENNAVATFFVVGNRAGIYSDSIKAAAKAGCQIGNHTYSHPWLSTLSPASIKSQMKRGNSAIKKRTGKNPTVCRTPGGETSSSIRNNVGMPIILWSIDTRDWATRDAGATYASVINNVSDGDIVLMHDLHDSTAVASKSIIPKLKKKGFQMVTVEELALLKGVKLKAGKVYTHF